MLPDVRARYRPEDLTEAAHRYGVDPASLRDLEGFEALVYGVSYQGRPAVLRLTEDAHRAPLEVADELAFIDHLHARGVRVARALPSPAGRLLERVHDHISAVVFELAPGRLPVPGDFAPPLYEAWGETIGRMHAAVLAAPPTVDARPRWPDRYGVAPSDVPPEEIGVVEACRAIEAQVGRLDLPRGLIHDDLHHGNFHVDEAGRVTVFDFDDCIVHALVNDLAVAIYHCMRREPFRDAMAVHAAVMLPALLRGYRRHREPSPAELAALPLLLRYRRAIMYIVMCRCFPRAEWPVHVARLLPDILADRDLFEMDPAWLV